MRSRGWANVLTEKRLRHIKYYFLCINEYADYYLKTILNDFRKHAEYLEKREKQLNKRREEAKSKAKRKHPRCSEVSANYN